MGPRSLFFSGSGLTLFSLTRPGGDGHACAWHFFWRGIVTFLAAVFSVETFFVTLQLRVPFHFAPVEKTTEVESMCRLLCSGRGFATFPGSKLPLSSTEALSAYGKAVADPYWLGDLILPPPSREPSR